MEIKTFATSEIKPYPNNPRKNDSAVESVMESIKQCGYCSPIIVDENMVILAGHTRFKAIKRLGWKECPVLIRTGMTEEQKRKYRLLDNKTSEIAEWDSDLLIEELEGLDFEGFDFGFDFGKEVTADAIDDDFDCTPPEEPKAKRGDIYQLGVHRLMCGDSTSADDVAKLSGGALMDMLLTDPPYGVDYVGKTKDALKIENDAQTDEELKTFLTEAFMAADAVMKPGAVFYIWHADSKAGIFRMACQMTGWEVRQVLIWVKNSMVLGRQDYQWKHEPCLYGWKDGAGHLWASDRKQTTILEFDRPTRNKEHPTMKPIPLFDYQIKNNTKGGDTVMDLFGGSGTTIMACEQNGRIGYVMEYDPKYVDVIINRWESFTGEKAVLLNG
ncbi:MAG: ParB N-terminal domain-containing protein [Clostridia bacterium]|nr:ParB N-terminal domain-containing protein [Clostridia bacterium]